MNYVKKNSNKIFKYCQHIFNNLINHQKILKRKNLKMIKNKNQKANALAIFFEK